MNKAPSAKADGEQGFALVSVLWGVSILSVIAAVALTASLNGSRIEANSWKEIHARTLAEAAIVRAVLGLLETNANARWRVDGVVQHFVFDDVPIDVSVQDELGKVDLNAARDDILRNLFHATVSDLQLADALTDRVLDWRTSSANKRVNGASAEDYQKVGSPIRPRGAAFQTIDELQFVLGMTPELYGRLEPAITVYSQRPGVELTTASPLALKAALGPNAAAPPPASGQQRPGVLDSSIGLGGRTFTVTAAVTFEKRVYTNQAVIRLTGDPSSPYWILAWRAAPAPIRVQ